jgi:hypothetical protein
MRNLHQEFRPRMEAIEKKCAEIVKTSGDLED